MTFTITPPEALKLPTPSKKTAVQFYDPSQPLGMRCAWAIEWIVFKDDEHTQHIHPRDWRFNGGAPDREKLPDAYLLAELEDTICRGITPFCGMAARQYFGYKELDTEGEKDAWRFATVDLLAKVHEAPIIRVSTYNPPTAKSMKVR
jgi:hypothetical protein